MESTGTTPGGWYKAKSCWTVPWVPKGHKWACWEGRKPTAWHLKPHNKHLGKQSCNCQFRNHKTFNPCKNRSVNVHLLDLSRYNCIWFCIVVCCQFIIHYLSVVICHLACFVFAFIHPARLFKICFHFCLFCGSALSDYSIFDQSVLFLSWYWKCVPSILIPITTTMRLVNKHHTTRLCLLLS
jgi:hypothetical protein